MLLLATSALAGDLSCLGGELLDLDVRDDDAHVAHLLVDARFVSQCPKRIVGFSGVMLFADASGGVHAVRGFASGRSALAPGKKRRGKWDLVTLASDSDLWLTSVPKKAIVTTWKTTFVVYEDGTTEHATVAEATQDVTFLPGALSDD